MTREDKLIAKIRRGEPIAQVRMWWLDELAKVEGELLFKDLSPFEQAFANQISYAFNEWQRQEQNADKTSTTH